MDIKNIPLGKVQTAGDWKAKPLKAGQMIAYASVFGNVDSYGDVVVKGAFANTLADWRKSGRTLPLLYGHNMHDPNMNIGAVVDAEEDDRGLKILAEFDPDDAAQKVYRLVKAGRIAELSFAFDTIKSALLDDPDRPDAFRELQEVKLYECSVVPIGANSETEVVAVKAAEEAMSRVTDGLKAGRALSKATETSLRSALEGIITAKDALETVLPKAEDDEDDAPDPVEDDDEDPKGGVPSEERGAATSADAAPVTGEAFKAAVLEILQEAGLVSPPSSDPEAAKADLLVTEIQLLELGPSE